jgi:hypothetical protein
MAGNSGVVVDDLALGKANLGIHDLIQIREANISTRYPHRCVLPTHFLPYEVQGSVILSSVMILGGYRVLGLPEEAPSRMESTGAVQRS